MRVLGQQVAPGQCPHRVEFFDLFGDDFVEGVAEFFGPLLVGDVDVLAGGGFGDAEFFRDVGVAGASGFHRDGAGAAFGDLCSFSDRYGHVSPLALATVLVAHSVAYVGYWLVGGVGRIVCAISFSAWSSVNPAAR